MTSLCTTNATNIQILSRKTSIHDGSNKKHNHQHTQDGNGSHRTASNYIGPCLLTRDRDFKSVTYFNLKLHEWSVEREVVEQERSGERGLITEITAIWYD